MPYRIEAGGLTRQLKIKELLSTEDQVSDLIRVEKIGASVILTAKAETAEVKKKKKVGKKAGRSGKRKGRYID